jgi:hypothetical protein
MRARETGKTSTGGYGRMDLLLWIALMSYMAGLSVGVMMDRKLHWLKYLGLGDEPRGDDIRENDRSIRPLSASGSRSSAPFFGQYNPDTSELSSGPKYQSVVSVVPGALFPRLPEQCA